MKNTYLNKIPGDMDIGSSFAEAFIYLPVGFRGLTKKVTDSLKNISMVYPELVCTGDRLPTIVFLTGSTDRGVEKILAEKLCSALGVGLIALNTHSIRNRPTYKSPAGREVYEAVHTLRSAEVEQFLEKYSELGWVDGEKLILMGLSEGAVTAACYPDKTFGLRVVLAWSCEGSYFTEDPVIGGDENTFVLSIIGYKDEFFGVNSRFGGDQKTDGHGARALQNHINSKVVIFPHCGHRLIEETPMVIDEICCFITNWLQKIENQCREE